MSISCSVSGGAISIIESLQTKLLVVREIFMNHQNIKGLTQSRFSVWKYLTGVLCAVLIASLFTLWDEFVLHSVTWQKYFHSLLTEHITAVATNASSYGMMLVIVSFAYGIFHAIGPGHGKAVIVTYLGTNKDNIRSGIFISFTAALMQALVAIVLVSLLSQILELKFSEVTQYGEKVSLVGYVLVMMLGLVLVLTGLRRIMKTKPLGSWSFGRLFSETERHSDEHEVSHNDLDHSHTHHHDHSHGHHSHEHSHNHHSHDHGSSCGCNHAYVPETKQTPWQTFLLILSMGFRPCSGAILVLIYAHLVGVYGYGVTATLMMGLGTGLSVSILAIIAVYARGWIERFIGESGLAETHSHSRFAHYVRIFGGIVLAVLGWELYQAATVVQAAHPLF
ncbi:hypothetical protein A3715_17425 [Oleiphilus sp. HI0009]|nr:hypothetical protein A3715_17425 [Oleiphilus sp. HI0009]